MISFEALQSSFNAVFCHSGHTSKFLICVGYHQYFYLQEELSPSYPYPQESFQSRNDIPMTKGHDKRSSVSSLQPSPPRTTPQIFFFNLADLQMEPIFFFFQPAAKRDLGFTNQVEYVYVIISEQLAPAQSWTRCLLELHVHHCLGEPHHL